MATDPIERMVRTLHGDMTLAARVRKLRWRRRKPGLPLLVLVPEKQPEPK